MACAVALFAAAAPASANHTSLVSSGPTGGYRGIGANFAGASTDGSRAFFTTAEQLVAGDTDSSIDVYERSGNTTTLISLGQGGTGNSAFDATFNAASGDGSKVFFRTTESLAAADTDAFADIYMREAGVTTWISAGDGAAGNGAFDVSIAITVNGKQAGVNASGSRVFFTTNESLTTNDSDGGSPDIYERFAGDTSLITTGFSGGGPGVHFHDLGGFSQDGTRVFFQTNESLHPHDTDTARDIYERSGPVTELISRTNTNANLADPASFNPNSLGGDVSADGSRVFFDSGGVYTPGDTDAQGDIYERANGTTTTRISTGNINGNGPFPTAFAGADETGTKIAFVTMEQLDTDDGDTTRWDVYGRDGTGLGLISQAGNSGSSGPFDIDVFNGAGSPDGSSLFFMTSEQLDVNDTDVLPDIYKRTGTAASGTTTLISFGTSTSAASLANNNWISADGSHVFFQTADSLVSDDTDSSIDIYERFGTQTRLVSKGRFGGNSVNTPTFWKASSDGLRAFFTTTDSLTGEDIDVSQSDVYMAATERASANGSISTGGSASAGDPLETVVSTPSSGLVTITEGTTTGTQPTGASFVDWESAISAPTVSAATPHQFIFRIHTSMLPPNFVDVTQGVASRNGVNLSVCIGAGASPDPCVSLADSGISGDQVTVTVRATTGGSYRFGYQSGKITAVKDAVPNDVQDFDLSVGGPGGLSPASFQLDDSTEATLPSSLTFNDVAVSNGYTLSETLPVNWTQTGASCSDASPLSNIDVGFGETVTCTITNTKQEAPETSTALDRVTKGPDGGNDTVTPSFRAVCQDGAFFETAESLVSADGDSANDVYLRLNGATTLISTGPGTGNGSSMAFEGASDDCSRAFFSTTGSLDPTNDTDSASDVYERTGATTNLISTGPGSGNASSMFFTGSSLDGTRVFFRTTGSLDPTNDTDASVQDIYQRLGSTTTLISTGPGTGNNQTMNFSGASTDGTRVFFTTGGSLDPTNDTDANADVYQRFGSTTTLISTGPGGGNVQSMTFLRASDDGTRVFFSTLGSLDSTNDTDVVQDVYERFGSTTTLISTGPGSGNGSSMTFAGASSTGNRVFFTTTGSLDATNDTDAVQDIYERAGSTTTLISTGPGSGNGSQMNFEQASQDGTRVVFTTTGSLDPTNDTDSDQDIYERAAGATTLVSRGQVAGPGVSFASFAGASADGTRVVFQTPQQLVSQDTDSSQDVYERSNGFTTLLSNGPDGGNGGQSASVPTFSGRRGISADGLHVFIQTQEALLAGDSDGMTDIYRANLDGASQTVGGGETVQTGGAPSASDPTETAVTTPATGAGGSVTITEGPVNQGTPSGFQVLDWQVNVSAPAGTTADPLQLVFRVDASILPAGTNETNLQVFRNGSAVPACTGLPNQASPDPCIPTGGRVALGGGDVQVTVLSSAASAWNFGAANGSVTIIKNAQPDDPQDFSFSAGGGLDPTGFQLDDDGDNGNALSNTRTYADVAPGTYSVSETVPGGWDQSSATCSDGSPVSAISVSPAESVTCTFTNQKRGTIVVKKDAQPNDAQDFSFTAGGGLAPASFQLDDDADGTLSDTQTFSNVPVGSGYSIAESVPSGWDQSSATCDDGSPVSNINVAPDETVTCTFTNRKRGTIVVTKNAQPDGAQDFSFTTGGGLTPASFQLDDDTDPTLSDTQTFSSVPSGSGYSVSETVPSGWDQQSATCDDGSPISNIDVAPAETVTCTFTNRKRGQVVVVMDAVPNDAQDFSFTAGGGLSPTSFQLDDDSDGTLSNTRTFNDVVPGSGYSISETVPGGWDQQSVSCDDGSPVSNIDVGAGEVVTCTFTNRKRGQIVIVKDAQPDDPQDFSFNAGGGLSPSSFQLDDDSNGTLSNTRTFSDVVPGSGYSVSETVPSGWDQQSVSCSDGSPVSNIDVGAGETVTCTFTNAQRGQIAVVKDALPNDPQDFDFTAGGGLSPTSFQLDDDSDGTLSNTRMFEVVNGSGYSLSETVPSGWDQQSATCSDGSPVSNIDVSSGETVTCTFTNRKRGQIVAVKDAVPNDAQDFSFTAGGGLSPTSFQLDDDSDGTLSNTRTFTDVPPATGYSLSETVPSGWHQQSANCSDGSPISNIDLSAGETITCTFTNQKRGQITLVKDTVPNDPQNFSFTAGGGLTPASFQLDDDSDPALSNTRTFNDVVPGSGYTLSETVPANWYQGLAECSDSSPVTNIDVSPGESLTCTFTNAKNYPRPGGGTPLRVPLVPEFKQCTSPNATHIGPLNEPSCTSPALESNELTMASTGVGQGSARLDVQPGNTSTQADEADFRISASASDVRKKSDGTDYTGKVILESTLRITDRSNDVAGVASGTAGDLAFALGIQCVATPGAAGATCTINTTADTLVPGTVLEGKRAIISALSLVLKDLGANATGASPGCDPNCGDGDEKVFLRQGVFAP